MAAPLGGQLVPHKLPNGSTVMVPDYLLAQQQGAAYGSSVPEAPAAPAPAPAASKGTILGVNLDNPFGWNSPPTMLGKPAAGPSVPRLGDYAGGAYRGAGAKEPEKKEEPKKPEAPGKVDPSSVVIKQPGSPQQQQASGDEMDPLVRRVYNESLRRGGGGGPRRDPGLVTSSVKTERQPGKEFLPEILQRAGLADEEDLGYEVDPNAAQSTIGTDDPVMRKRRSALNQATDMVGGSALQQFDQQEKYRLEQSAAQRQALLDQSTAIDEQLQGVAERRQKVADLQAIADKRMQEAEAFTPRSKSDVWEEKGPLAQVMSAISIAIGGYTAGLGRNGGKNAGWEMVNKILDDEVEADRYKSESRKKVGLNARSDLERAQTLYGDLDTALLETKGRKIASVIAMTNAMLNDRSLDESAKQRALQFKAQAEDAFLAQKQQIYDAVQGTALKQEVTQTPGKVTGGGGGGATTLKALEDAARAKKAQDTITGADGKPKANPTEQAELNAEEADMAPLKGLLTRYKGADTIPGVQPKGAPKRALRGVVDWVGGEGTAASSLDSDEERANKMIVERAALAYRHKMTGAGGNIKELAGIDEAFAGARTRADLERAVRVAEQSIAERRRLSGGGASTAQAPAATPSSFRPE
jgi:hypothetical protein